MLRTETFDMFVDPDGATEPAVGFTPAARLGLPQPESLWRIT